MIACPSCGFDCSGDFAFCPKCATPLAAPPPIAEERKTVTTLFCDLVAFTAMSEAADPEDVDHLLADYFARATRVIESHGGTVEKFIGDAVMGVFGVPAVHEDDPERAVRAALRILEALEGMTRPDGAPLQVRCGVNTGEALVRLDVDPASGKGLLTGDAVNTAARLEAAAPPGGVVVGALTHALTERVIVYEELPHVLAKGKTEPLAVWLAMSPVSRRGIDVEATDLTPLVGREGELAYLTAVFEKATTQSTPQFVLIVGEPGVGKSRLVRELLTLIDAKPEMTTWRQGYCPPFGEDITYWALAKIVRGHAGIRDTDQGASVEAKLESILPSGPDREWFRQRLRALLGLAAPDASRMENFAAWARFFEHVSAVRPAVLVFEDLHWADEALLAFLEYLSAHVASAPLLIIGTTRPELFERDPGFARGGRLDHLHLEPLSKADTARLVAGLIGEPQDRDGVIRHVVERCDGNPFYVEQSVRLLTDTQIDGQVPDSVQAVIAARLDALPVDQKALLGDAAVVGTVFWDGVLSAMGAREPHEVDDILSGLLERHLIRRIHESSMAGVREYAFVHALARDVAYGELPRVARARRHGAAARWLEARAEGHLDDLVEVLAHHFTTALDLAHAAGESDLAAQFEEPSMRCLRLAGDRAFNLDVQAAEQFYAAALKMSAADSPERARLDLRLGEAALWSGRCEEAAKHLELAAVALRASGELRSAAVALARLARARDYLHADPRDVTALYREAVDLLEGDEPSNARVAVLTEWGRELGNAGEVEAALEAFEGALQVAHELGVPEPPLALSLRGSVRATEGDAGFLEDYRRALEAAEEQGLGIERARLWNNFALDVGLVEGPRRSLEEYERVRAFEERLGSPTGYARDNRIVALVCAGDWDEALREADELERDFGAGWPAGLQGLLLVHLLRLLPLIWRGARAEVREHLSPALDEARRSGVAVDQSWGLTVAAIATAPDDLDKARILLEQMVSTAKTLNDVSLYHMLPEAVRIALRCGDSGLAGSISGVVRGGLPALQNTQASIAALRAEHSGDHEAAAASFADAAARWREFGVPYEEAQALLGQGRCLVALGRRNEARRPLRGARAIFKRLGAEPALRETDEWLAKVGKSVDQLG